MQAAVPLACFLSMIRPPGIQYENAVLQIAPVDKSQCPYMKDSNDVGFLLYTRHNPTVYQELILGDDEKLFASNMDFHDQTVFYFHAWMEQPEDGSAVLVREAYMQRGDANVIMVDARHLEAGPWYFTAAQNTWYIGRFVAQFVDYMVTRGLNLNNTHFVGHSLGAQAAGVAGSALKSGQVARITGLDPALPLFENLPLQQRLDPTDAAFVDIIHTDAGIFGYKVPMGHVDFYPNGGISPQPGCELEVVIPKQLLLNKCDKNTQTRGFYTYYLTQRETHSKPKPIELKLEKLFTYIQNAQVRSKVGNIKGNKDKKMNFIRQRNKVDNGVANMSVGIDNNTQVINSIVDVNNTQVNNNIDMNVKATLSPRDKDEFVMARVDNVEMAVDNVNNINVNNSELVSNGDGISTLKQGDKVDIVRVKRNVVSDNNTQLRLDFKDTNNNSTHNDSQSDTYDINSTNNNTYMINNSNGNNNTQNSIYKEEINKRNINVNENDTSIIKRNIDNKTFIADGNNNNKLLTDVNNNTPIENKEITNTDVLSQELTIKKEDNFDKIESEDNFEDSNINTNNFNVKKSKVGSKNNFMTNILRLRPLRTINLITRLIKPKSNDPNKEKKPKMGAKIRQFSSKFTPKIFQPKLEKPEPKIAPQSRMNTKLKEIGSKIKNHVVKRQKRFLSIFQRAEEPNNNNFVFKILDFLVKNRRNVLPVLTVMREVNTLIKSANGELNHVTKESNNFIGVTPPPLEPVTYNLELGGESKMVAFVKRLLGMAVRGDRLTITGR